MDKLLRGTKGFFFSQRSENGQGLVEYALLIMMAGLVLIGALFLVADATGNSLGQVIEAITIEGEPTPTPLPGPKDVLVTVLDQNDTGLSDTVVLAYDGDGAFLAKTGTTGSSGSVIFNQLDPGTYRFRADHQLKAFWSEYIVVPGQNSTIIRINGTPITVNIVNSYGNAMAGIAVYAFNDHDSYLGLESTSSAAGTVSFNLTDGNYKFRADYSGSAYWSPVISVPETNITSITISLTPVEVRVRDRAGNPIGGLTVDAYLNADGSSQLSSNAVTNAAGIARFELEAGQYRFVTRYQDVDHASNTIEVPSTTSASITVKSPIRVQVFKKNGTPANNASVYAYEISNGYNFIGTATSGNDGIAYFSMQDGSLNDGRYMFLAKKTEGNKNIYAWSDPITIPPDESTSITLPK